MELSEYQEAALTTAKYGKGESIIYPTLGLCGEAGEISEKVKKVLRDKGGDFSSEERLEIAKEIGDVLWYCSALAHDIGFSLEHIAELNLEKLKSRMLRDKISGSGDNR